MANIIIGVDEVGRGSLVGDVVVAAVAMHENDAGSSFWQGLQDSKKLSSQQIKDRSDQVQNNALVCEISKSGTDEIEQTNILQATLNAMAKAIEKTIAKIEPNCESIVVYIDGNQAPVFQYSRNIKVITVIKGDGKVPAISAASIVAKNFRDNYVIENLAPQFPVYQWHKNMGYGTEDHIAAIKKHGITKYHRKYFCKDYIDSSQLKLL